MRIDSLAFLASTGYRRRDGEQAQFLSARHFIDIGAVDGIRANNTFTLERQLGWTCICVEPNSRKYSELRQNRSCVCENLCAYSRAGTVKFTEPGVFPAYGGITKHLVPHKRKW